MKIYVAHTRDSDFQNELYTPIKNSLLSKEHTFIFPHEVTAESFSSKEFFKTDCALVIAEVSYPATGLGIELGWADMLNVPIACIYRRGSKISNSLKAISKLILEYENATDMIEKIQEAIKLVQ